MLSWFLEKLGIQQTLTGQLEQVQWLWARPTVLLVGLALLLPAAIFIVLRHRNNLAHVSRPVRVILSVCRIGILLVLIIVLGGPFLRLTEPVSSKPLLFWLLDESESMSLPVGNFSEEETVQMAAAAGMMEKTPEGGVAAMDAQVRKEMNNMNRAEFLQRVLEKHKPLLDEFKERFELRSYRFARNLVPGTAESGGGGAEVLTAGQKDTNLGGVLEEVMDQMAGRKSAGIVVFSDGQSTMGADPAQVLRRYQTVTTEQTTVPVWTVPVGSSEPLVDIACLDVLCPGQLTLQDTAVLVATVHSYGFDGRAVKVRLLEQEKVLEEKELILTGGQRQQVQLTFEAKEAGTHLLMVEVEKQGEEQVPINNRMGVSIEVDEQRWKVLYLEGYPRWDFRFLDYVLRRDQGLEVTMVMEASLAAERKEQEELYKRAHLPGDVKGFADYDVVMLGDITAALLPPVMQEPLAQAVEREGVGLIVQAGPQAMPHAFAGEPLARLLPMTFSADKRGFDAPAFAPFQMAVTAQGSIHPAFRLYDSATQNRGVWSRMPTFYWAAAGEEISPAATLLAELTVLEQQKMPLIVEQYAGAGRVLFIGTDSTYRWRAYIGDPLFSRFWGQAIRHVARSRQRSGRSDWLEVYPARVEAGESVSLELYALDGAGKPLAAGELAGRVVSGEKAGSISLKPTAEAGHFRGTWTGSEEGEYVFQVEAEGKMVTGSVRVSQAGRELLRPDVDRDTMGSLAELSRGGLLELPDIGKLSQSLQGEIRTTQRIHEDEIWDNWFTLILLVSLYCTDVLVRRISGLT